jgi:type IV pilus assembly protein PilN
MIRINLLPFRAARKKENVRRQVSIFLLSFILIIIAVFYYNNWLSNHIKKLEARNQETTKQIAKYDKINKEIAQIKNTLNSLKKKIQVIETLDSGRKNAVNLLESMTEMIIEERMWFTVLSVNGNSISLGGIALDERTIADFMKRLETKGGYANVTLKSLQRKEIKGKSLNLKSFNLSLNLPVSKSAKEKNKAGKTKKS